MKRRNFITAAAGALAAGIAAAAKATSQGLEGMPDTISVGTPGADRVIVFNRETGEVQRLVQRVCQSEGWIDQIRVWSPKPDVFGAAYKGKECLCVGPDGKVITDRIYGPWAVRWRTESDAPRVTGGPTVYGRHEDLKARLEGTASYTPVFIKK